MYRPDERLRLLIVLTLAAGLGAAVGVMFTALAELQDTFALSDAQIGVISGMAFLSTMVATLGFGPIADRGFERPLMVAGALVAVVALVATALGDTFVEFAVARTFQGIGYGMFVPAARRTLVQMRPDHAGQAMGWMGGAEIGGVIGGPAIGAVIAHFLGMDAPFWILAVLLAVATFGLFGGPLLADVNGPIGAHPSVEARASGAPSGFRGALGLLRSRRIVGVLFLSVAVYLPVGIYDSLWSRFLTDRGATKLWIGFSLLFFGLPVALLSGRGGALADRFGPMRVASWSVVLVFGATAIYGWLTKPGWVAVFGVIEGVGTAGLSPAVLAMLVAACPPSQLSSGQSLALASNELAAAAGAFFGPQIYGRYGGGPIFTGSVVLMVACWFVGVGLYRQGEVSDPPTPVVSAR